MPDPATGRFLTGLQVRATVRTADGHTLGTMAEPFTWHSWIHHFGDRVSAPSELEGRLILEHDFHDFPLDLDPTLAREFVPDSSGLQLGLRTGVCYRRFRAVQPGLELHGELGPAGDIRRARKQEQRLFPTLDLRFASGVDGSVGVGVGLTNASDRLTLRSIFSGEFPTIRPSSQAQ